MSNQKLKWYGIREGGSATPYCKLGDFVNLQIVTNLKLLTTERNDAKEYYCKLCGAGLPYGSLHSVRMHALENHDKNGEFSTGFGN